MPPTKQILPILHGRRHQERRFLLLLASATGSSSAFPGQRGNEDAKEGSLSFMWSIGRICFVGGMLAFSHFLSFT